MCFEFKLAKSCSLQQRSATYPFPWMLPYQHETAQVFNFLQSHKFASLGRN